MKQKTRQDEEKSKEEDEKSVKCMKKKRRGRRIGEEKRERLALEEERSHIGRKVKTS